MVTNTLNRDEIFDVLSAIADPEIPVVNIREMGMLRDVTVGDNGVEVVITPTYSGCPAMGIIGEDIKMTLHRHGVQHVSIKLVYNPAWTTDWMTNTAKMKLKHYGIAPPLHTSCNKDTFASNIIQCPRCHSFDTVPISQFGSTACKALYKCNDCKEPFEYFKCH